MLRDGLAAYGHGRDDDLLLASARKIVNGGRKDTELVKAVFAYARDAALDRFRWTERDLAFREAVCLFRICTNTIRRPQEDWRSTLGAGLFLVNETLG